MPLVRLQKALQMNSPCSLYNCFKIFQTRSYSTYPPTFVKPVYHPDQIKKLSPEEVRELLHKNIKPPEIHQNASMFHDPLLRKFTNHVMKGGDKATARQIIEETFEKIKKIQIRKFHLAKDPEAQEKIPTFPLDIFQKAVQNCKPVLNVTPVKKGGVVYKVPIAITDERATSMALKWLVEAAREHEPRRKHTGEYFSDRLAKELMDALANSGKSVKRKVELHKLCEANKAYAHYRWTK